jgi:hypothetical protein
MKFHVTPSKARLIDHFKQELGVSSEAEVINYALTVLQWVLKHRRSGMTVAAVDETNRQYITLQLPNSLTVAS